VQHFIISFPYFNKFLSFPAILFLQQQKASLKEDEFEHLDIEFNLEEGEASEEFDGDGDGDGDVCEEEVVKINAKIETPATINAATNKGCIFIFKKYKNNLQC
jgi:hypothetical protein